MTAEDMKREEFYDDMNSLSDYRTDCIDAAYSMPDRRGANDVLNSLDDSVENFINQWSGKLPSGSQEDISAVIEIGNIRRDIFTARQVRGIWDNEIKSKKGAAA